jgi:hypothetical protein
MMTGDYRGKRQPVPGVSESPHLSHHLSRPPRLSHHGGRLRRTPQHPLPKHTAPPETTALTHNYETRCSSMSSEHYYHLPSPNHSNIFASFCIRRSLSSSNQSIGSSRKRLCSYFHLLSTSQSPFCQSLPRYAVLTSLESDLKQR